MRDKIFISYSHLDNAYLDELKVYLKPLQRRGKLVIWTDRELATGEDWDAKIRQALNETAVALMLITPRFLSSEYISATEVPILLGAHQRDEIGLACLYLETSVVDETEFDARVSDTQVERVRLTDFQGLNSPTNPLAGREGNDRAGLLTQSAKQLVALYQDHTAVAPPRPGPETVADRPILDVRLIPHQDRFIRLFRASDDWRMELPATWSFGIDGPVREPELFAALFGEDEAEVGQILRCATGRGKDGAPSPDRFPLRVRIECAHPNIVRSPWAQMRWNGTPLVQRGWSFELVPPSFDRSTANLHQVLQTPCSVMALIGGDVESDSTAHIQSFHQALDNVWPAYPHKVVHPPGPAEAVADWQEHEPQVLYVLDRLTPDAAAPRLVGLDIEIDGLAEIWGRCPPKLVLLNLIGEHRPGAAKACMALADRVSLLVVQFGDPSQPHRARQAALAWLNALFTSTERDDPVFLLHHEALPGAFAIANYGRWTTKTSGEPPRKKLAHLLLDRKFQRSEVNLSLSELVNKHERRMHCFVVAGEAGNLVELFVDQILEWFRRYSSELGVIKRLRLQLPTRAEDFDFATLARQVRRDLLVDPRDPICEAIASHRVRSAHRDRSVLLLDWGMHGGEGRPVPGDRALDAWVELNAREVAGTLSCPEARDLKLLSCLSLEMPEARQRSLKETIGRLRASNRGRAFRMALLPFLDRVEEQDLVEFLDDADHSTIPAKLLDDMPGLLIGAGGGSFDKTVELIERAEDTTWYELYQELQARQRASSTGTAPTDTSFDGGRANSDPSHEL